MSATAAAITTWQLLLVLVRNGEFEMKFAAVLAMAANALHCFRLGFIDTGWMATLDHIAAVVWLGYAICFGLRCEVIEP